MLSYLIRKLFALFERKEDLFEKYASQINRITFDDASVKSLEDAIRVTEDFGKILYHYNESLKLHIGHRGAELPIAVFSDRNRTAYRLQSVRKGEYQSHTPVTNVTNLMNWMLNLSWDDQYKLSDRTGYFSLNATASTWGKEISGDLNTIVEFMDTSLLFIQRVVELEDPRRVLSYFKSIIVYMSLIVSLVHDVLVDAGWLEGDAHA